MTPPTRILNFAIVWSSLEAAGPWISRAMELLPASKPNITGGSNSTSLTCTQSQGCHGATISSGSGLFNLTCGPIPTGENDPCHGAAVTQGSGALSETVASGNYLSFTCLQGQWQCSSNLTAPDCVDDYLCCPQFGSSPLPVPFPPPPPLAVPTNTVILPTGCLATVYDDHATWKAHRCWPTHPLAPVSLASSPPLLFVVGVAFENRPFLKFIPPSPLLKPGDRCPLQHLGFQWSFGDSPCDSRRTTGCVCLHHRNCLRRLQHWGTLGLPFAVIASEHSFTLASVCVWGGGGVSLPLRDIKLVFWLIAKTCFFGQTKEKKEEKNKKKKRKREKKAE